MNWRKEIYKVLEASEDHADLLTATKEGLKALDQDQGALRIAEKKATTLEGEVTELKTQLDSAGGSDKDKAELVKQVTTLEGKNKKLEKDLDKKLEALKTAEATIADNTASATKNTIIDTLGTPVKKALGDFAGNLLLKNLISDKALGTDEKGNVILSQDGVVYTGKDEILERIRTDNKEYLQAEDGADTKPNTGKQGAKVVDLSDKSASDLIAEAVAGM